MSSGSLEVFETQRRNLGFAPNEFITPRVRLEHVDRMVEVRNSFVLNLVFVLSFLCFWDRIAKPDSLHNPLGGPPVQAVNGCASRSSVCSGCMSGQDSCAREQA